MLVSDDLEGFMRDGDEDLIAHPLAYVRSQRNWTYQDVVDVVARRVGNAAARREKAWRWEKAGVVPDRWSQLALAAELGVPEVRVRELAWPAWLVSDDAALVGHSWTSAGTLAAAQQTVERAIVDRRSFMAMSGGALADLAASWSQVETPRLVAALGGGRVDATLVAALEEGLPRLRSIEAAYGGARAHGLLHAEFTTVVEILAGASYSAVTGKALHVLAGEIARMCGFAAFDAGRHAAAQYYWSTALRCAHASGDDLLGANTLKSMSLQCHDFGRPGDALMLAEVAAARSGPATPRTRAMLGMRLARAQAALRDKTASESTMSMSETWFTRAVASDEDPPWAGYFDEAEFHAQTAQCLLDLGRPASADARLAHTLQLIPASRTRDRVTYMICQARAQASLHEVDSAVDLLSRAIPLMSGAPSVRNGRRLKRAMRELPLKPEDERMVDLRRDLAAVPA